MANCKLAILRCDDLPKNQVPLKSLDKIWRRGISEDRVAARRRHSSHFFRR